MTHVRGRGPGQRENARFSLAVENPASVVGTVVLKIKGKEGDTLPERHRKLLRMAEYLQLRHAYHCWYPASLVGDSPERVLYVRVPQHTIATIKREVWRKGLSMEDRERVSSFPYVPAVEAPIVEGVS